MFFLFKETLFDTCKITVGDKKIHLIFKVFRYEFFNNKSHLECKGNI